MNHPKKTALLLAVQVALAASFGQNAFAQSFPAEIELSDVSGSVGLVIEGAAAGDRAGHSVSAAGDFNGDGIDDLIIGALNAEPNNNIFAGKSYIVFGSTTGLADSLDLSTIDGTNGIVFNGEDDFDNSGESVSGAGDINGDGVDDVIIGAPDANSYGNNAGRSYVVFGTDSGLVSPFELSDIDGNNGFALYGEDLYDGSGGSVSAVGDINSDGIDDLVIGARTAEAGGISRGRTYVVFGSTSTFPNPFNLNAIDGDNGFVLNGENNIDFSGSSVSGVGDFNGDGIDDLIIGAPLADYDGDSNVGRAYVVFGSISPFEAFIDLSSIDGTNGLVLIGENEFDTAGHSVSAAGDINNDGFDDVIVGARYSDQFGKYDTGRSYVVFGAATGIPSPLLLGTLDGSNGFAMDAVFSEGNSGVSVSGAGDINGDGIDDLIIGANKSYPSGIVDSGRSYVVFGSEDAFPSMLILDDLDGSNGFALNGESKDDQSGISVSAAGDFNGDGLDDLIIGAGFADDGIDLDTGKSYVIFGRTPLDLFVSKGNGVAYVDTGASTTWVVQVGNNSAIAVNGALLNDPIPAGVTDATWTCTSTFGASCPNASGAGSINETVDLPSANILRYEITATVTAVEPDMITNTATITLPDGLIDINPANNSATDSDPVALFVDSLEDFSFSRAQ